MDPFFSNTEKEIVTLPLVTGNGILVIQEHEGSSMYSFMHVDCYGNSLGRPTGRLIFQDGNITDCGVNGVSDQAVLAVLVDRANDRYQADPSVENASFLDYLRCAYNAFDDIAVKAKAATLQV